MTAMSSTITKNKKASHDYFFEEQLEAGLCLEGWELKSIRAGKVHIKEGYVLIRKGEAFLFGAHITPLASASTHVNPDPVRNRKLLLHKKELDKLIGKVKEKGLTLVPVSLYWKRGRVKCEIALARGKKLHDKRQTLKDRDWARDKARMLKR